ncbi:MAG: hypothetical protein ACXACG_18385 [Candidatus Thorarchaeota archaeon]|jgi:hypothetical protein
MKKGLAIPYAISVDGLFEVMAAWGRLDDQSKPATKDDVANVCKLGPESVRKQNPFLEQIGFLVKEGKHYSTSASGNKLAKFADYMMTEEFSRLFRDLVASWSELNPVLRYIQGIGKAKREEVVSRIILHSTRKRDNKDTISGAEALVDLLAKGNIINIEEDEITISEAFNLEAYDDKISHLEPKKIQELTGKKSKDNSFVEVKVIISIHGEIGEETKKFIDDIVGTLQKLGFSG